MINSTESFLSSIQLISSSFDRIKKATREDFNIFSILEKEVGEVSTHSNFISELLDSNGRHRQGSLFLKLWLKRFDIHEFDPASYFVKKEQYIGRVTETSGGQIDILIQDKLGNVIMIENKIYAGDQPNQLLRYRNSFPEARLFYLTLFGNDSADANKSKVIYTPIAYSQELIDWLSDCKRAAIDIPIIRETISQYITLIKKLTNQSNNTIMNQELVNHILNSQNNFEAYKALSGIQNIVFRSVVEKKVVPVLKDLASKYKLEMSFELEKFLDNSRFKGVEFSNESLRDNNLIISFGFESTNNRDMIYCLRYIKKESSNDDIAEKAKPYLDEYFNIYQKNDNHLIWVFYQEYRNWRNLDTLQDILYGNFQSNFESKLLKLLSINDNITSLRIKQV